MGCGGCGRDSNKINRTKNGTRKKLKQTCISCNFTFYSSTIFDCCPKCDKKMTLKKVKRLNNEISGKTITD